MPRYVVLWSTVMIGMAALPAQAADDATGTCNPEVFKAVKNFAENGGKAASATKCDSGCPESGTCQVAGLRVDKGCFGLGDKQLEVIMKSIREVRGEGGLGCVNSMNANLAKGLLAVFHRTPPLTICCDQCQAPGLSTETLEATACAVTPPRTGKDAAQNTVILRTSGPGSVFGTGDCGSKRYEKPIAATILHEMLHAAGLAGNDGHQGRGATDSETGTNLDERDFLPDPVYGCENSCFGVAKSKNSLNCLSCAGGTLMRLPCKSASDPLCDLTAGNFCVEGKPGCTKDELAKYNVATAYSEDLVTGIRAREKAAWNGGSGVPAACMDLWKTKGDPGRYVYRAYKEGLGTIVAKRDEAKACLAGMKASASEKLADYAKPCTGALKTIGDACQGFAKATSCQAHSSVGLYTEATIQECHDMLDDYHSKMMATLRLFKKLHKTENLAGFRCEDYFSADKLCNVSGEPTGATVSSCTAELNKQ